MPKTTAPNYFFRVLNQPIFAPASPLEVLLFTRHLATMIKAGIPLAEALSSLAEDARTVSFRQVIFKLSQDVQNGQSLTQAMSKHPRVFDQFYQSLISVSEKTGTLDEHLGFMAIQLEKSYSLHKKIRAALLYPQLVLTAAIIMSGFIAFFILPQLVTFFSAFEIELPLTTQVLLFIANAFKYHSLAIAATIIATVTTFHILIRLPFIKPAWQSFILTLPYIGQFLQQTQLAHFSRNLGVLLKSGVEVITAMEITAHTLSNVRYQNDVLELSTQLKKGVSIGETLAAGPYFEFPHLTAKMIAVGEKTGNLDESLFYLGDFYEQEIDATVQNLTTLLEPVMLLIIGLIVAFIALAIISPIYELTGSIRR